MNVPDFRFYHDFKRILSGTRFHQESYKRFVTAMSQDNMIDFNWDFTDVPKWPN